MQHRYIAGQWVEGEEGDALHTEAPARRFEPVWRSRGASPRQVGKAVRGAAVLERGWGDGSPPALLDETARNVLTVGLNRPEAPNERSTR